MLKTLLEDNKSNSYYPYLQHQFDKKNSDSVIIVNYCKTAKE